MFPQLSNTKLIFLPITKAFILASNTKTKKIFEESI